MNISFNTITPDSNNCRKPNFTAQLKGSALRSAIKEAKDASQLFEVPEIIENVRRFGDKNTIINCASDGQVTVSNEKFSQMFVNKFKLKKNVQTENPCLDLLKVFTTENRIMKLEQDLFDTIFSHTRGLEAKKAKFKLYSSYDLPVTTSMVLKNSAKNNGILTDTNVVFSAQQKQDALNKLKDTLLKNLQSNF